MVSAMHPRNAYSDLSRAISRRIGPPAGLSPADAGKAAADTASMLTRNKTTRMGLLHLDEQVTRRRTHSSAAGRRQNQDTSQDRHAASSVAAPGSRYYFLPSARSRARQPSRL